MWTVRQWLGCLTRKSELAKKLRSGGAYYDVGSNVGCVLIPLAKIVGESGQAIGFEPQPANHLTAEKVQVQSTCELA